MTKNDVKETTVEEPETQDVEVEVTEETKETKVMKLKKFIKNNYKSVLVAGAAGLVAGYVGRSVVLAKQGKIDFTEDEDESQPDLVADVPAEDVEEASDVETDE